MPGSRIIWRTSSGYVLAVVSDPIPVLWLCGPPGVGKSTIGCEIFTQLSQAGVEAGYVDIDQLGMCYPVPVSDPGRHRMKARNLDAVVTNYRAAGARCGLSKSSRRRPCRISGQLMNRVQSRPVR